MMKMSTYMIIGSLIVGWSYGSAVRDKHKRCPKDPAPAIDWTMVQLTVVWPALIPFTFLLPDYPLSECRIKE